MPQMRLCAVADVDAQLCAQDPLLPLPRLGRVAPSRRLSVRLPTDPPGPARSDRVARGRPPDRGPDAHPGGTRPTPRRSPRGRTDEAAARRSRTRADADQEEHGTPGHGLPGGPLTPRRTAIQTPELRAREQSARAELQAILDQAADRMLFLRLAETLVAFLQRLHELAQSLEIADRQKIVRLLVKDILVDNDTITIRHSIPSHPRTPPHGTEPPSDAKSQMDGQGYLLRSGSADRALRRPLHRLNLSALFKQPCRQPFADQPDDPPVADPMLNKPYQPCMADRVEERPKYPRRGPN